MTLAQADGDAYPDIIIVQTDLQTRLVSWRMFPGGPSGFGTEQRIADGLEYYTYNSIITDLNGDGVLDVASGHSLILADPAGGFRPPQAVFAGSSGIQEVADFNNDGKVDLRSSLGILLQK